MATPNNRGRGLTADRPLVLGRANGDDAIEVKATGLYLGIRNGEQRWVTGDLVDDGLSIGILIPLDADAAGLTVTEPAGNDATNDMTVGPIISEDKAKKVLDGTVPEVVAYFDEHPEFVEQLQRIEADGQGRKGIANYEPSSSDD